MTAVARIRSQPTKRSFFMVSDRAGLGFYDEEILELLGLASAYWRASDASGAPGYLLDGSGNGHTAALGATPRATLTGEALQLPGTAGNYASVPDAAALDITGDIDIRCAAALNDWTPGAVSVLAAKWDGASNNTFLFRVETGGSLRIFYTSDGTSSLNSISTAVPTVTDGALLLVRVTMDVDNGASGRDVKFFTKNSTPSAAAVDLAADTGWTQLGSTVTTAGAISLFSGTAPLEIGSQGLGATNPAAGRIYAAVIKDGIDGTTVLDVDFTGNTGATSFTADTGQTVTINRSAAGTDVPKFLEHDGDDYVWLPGTAGNYVELAPDVNLLDANTAHLEQGVGKWVQLGATTSVRLQATPTPEFGSSALAFNVGAIASYVYLGEATSNYVDVVAGTTYAWGARVRVSSSMNVLFRVTWYNGADALISHSDKTLVGVAEDAWTTVSNSAVAPTGAVHARLQIGTADVGKSGEIFHVDKVCFRTGSDPTFVPSTRITGDLDLRAKLAMDDWTPAAPASLLGKMSASANRSYRLDAPGATLQFAYSDDGTTYLSAVSSVAPPGANGEVQWVRATRNATTGDVKFYTGGSGATPAWVQLGTTQSTTPGAIFATNAKVEFGTTFGGTGSMLAGKGYAAEVRDGIDGPIVASFNANAITEPHTTFVTPEGHTATLKRSASGLVTAVVDRSLFVLDGVNDYMQVANHADINMDTEDFSIVAVFRSHSNHSSPSAIIKKFSFTNVPPNSHAGWNLRLSGTVSVTARFHSNEAAGDRAGTFASYGTTVTAAQRLNRATDIGQLIIDGVQGGTDLDASAHGSYSTTSPLIIGRNDVGGANHAHMEFIGAAVFKGTALTDAQIARVAAHLGA